MSRQRVAVYTYGSPCRLRWCTVTCGRSDTHPSIAVPIPVPAYLCELRMVSWCLPARALSVPWDTAAVMQNVKRARHMVLCTNTRCTVVYACMSPSKVCMALTSSRAFAHGAFLGASQDITGRYDRYTLGTQLDHMPQLIDSLGASLLPSTQLWPGRCIEVWMQNITGSI